MAARLVVGLGNPGEEYERTRHNMGFQVVDRLADRWKATFRRTPDWSHAQAWPEGIGSAEPVRLVKPTSYMNLCGPLYVSALKFFDVEASDALVVVDDFMLPFGKLRLRAQGSSGGHNGLKSVEGALGGQGYPRLRIGIGPVPGRRDPADFVLQRYNAAERKELPFVIEEAADAVVAWLRDGMAKAMERYNRKDDEEA